MNIGQLKIETKVSIAALILSVMTLSVNEVRDYQYTDAERKRAEIKLNLIDILSENARLDRKSIITIYNSKFGSDIGKEEVSQALYETLKDNVVLFIYDYKAYELNSYKTMHTDSNANN